MSAAEPWFEAWPAVYRDENHTLQHGLSYFKFLTLYPLQETGGLLVYEGELEYGQGQKHLIQVKFPNSYPYSPPEIIPIIRISNNNQNFTAVRPFGRGNQYSSGKICLFRDEEEWVPFVHGVGMAISQARSWLEAATSVTGFTKDLIVEEDNGIIGHLGQVIHALPAEFPEGKNGLLYLKSFKENYYSLLQVSFQNSAGTVVLESIPEGTFLSPTNNEYVIGKWVRVENDLSKNLLPNLINPENFKQFLSQIYVNGIDELLINPTYEPKKTVFGIFLGLNKELHFFQITYWREGITTKFNLGYLLPKNLKKELFVRIDSLFNLDLLKNKRVLIIGLGSIGSEVSKELSASNIGNLTLIDEEHFDVGNSVRHAADLFNIGEKKVDIAKRIIHGRNPFAKVRVIPSSLLDIPLLLLNDLIAESDVILDFTANRLVELFLHQKACVENKKPVIQAAVSKGGLTGIVLVAIPGQSACLKCLANSKKNYVPTSLLSTDSIKETPPDYGACSKPALPASGLDTKEVAIQAARVTLQYLLQGQGAFYPELEGYQYYWHGPAGSKALTGSRKKKPFEWEIQNFTPELACEICNKE